MNKLVLALLTSVLGLALVATPVLAWPGWVEGRPTLLGPGSATGYYLWHDADGLHLRTTTRELAHRFSGYIATDGMLRDVTSVRPEGGDVVLTRGTSELAFSFRTDEGIDGVDFRIEGGNFVRFALDVDGHRIPEQRIFVGFNNTHPADNPLVLPR